MLYKSATFSSTNHPSTVIATYNDLFGCQKTSFVRFDGFCKKVIDPSNLGGHNFFNSNPFLTIFDARNGPIGGVQVLFEH
jgi:hypothetical protein